MPPGKISAKLSKLLVKDLTKESKSKHELVIDPFCWKDCFEESSNWSDEEIRLKVISDVAREEKRLHLERLKKRQGVVGKAALRNQDFFKRFVSKTYRARSICISTRLELAKQYREYYREFCAQCRNAWEKWSVGDFSAKYPPGAFRPRISPTASALAFGFFT